MVAMSTHVFKYPTNNKLNAFVHVSILYRHLQNSIIHGVSYLYIRVM